MATELLPVRVFVADDDPMILQLLRTRLEVAGYQTAGARDGRQAIQAIPEFKPHALVLDINMPHLDGYGVLRVLRARVETRSIPVLVLTARHGAEDVQTAISLGAKDFLAKPFKDADLLARVSRLLRRRPPVAARPVQDVFL